MDAPFVRKRVHVKGKMDLICTSITSKQNKKKIIYGLRESCEKCDPAISAMYAFFPFF